MSEVITLALNAAEAAPAVIAGLQSIAGAVETSLDDHKTVGETAAGALTALGTTLTSPAITGLVGKTDAANIASGVSLAGELEELVETAAATEQKIAAFFKKIF